ncbi:MAG: sigma-54 dependent transcriptional regulator [Pseudomonadota bacterium]
MIKETDLLIIDNDSVQAHLLEGLAEDKRWSYVHAKTGEEAIRLLNQQLFKLVIVDVKLPGFSGLQVLEYIKLNRIFAEVIMLADPESMEVAVQGIKKGAYGYLTKPLLDLSKVQITVEKAFEHYGLNAQVRDLKREKLDRISYEGIIGRSKKIQEIFNTIDSVAATNSTILITGESGTGKEMVAKAIHSRSNRKNKKFVVINCAAIPEQLMESELFGHKRGSFTGAIADKKGLFEEANGGTVFLDEIGEVSPVIQVKLLRTIQEGEVKPVGSGETSQVDVRIISATNQDLVELVKQGLFREDLYYRLNVITLHMPSLRERMEDIPLLTYHFLEKYSQRVGRIVSKISIDALQALQNHEWIGNVRELENVIERAVVLSSDETLSISDLPPRVLGDAFYLYKEDDLDLSKYSYREAKERALVNFNRSYLRNLLKQTSGNISFAAQKAHMDRSNFKKLIKKYGVDPREIVSPAREWSLKPGGSK